MTSINLPPESRDSVTEHLNGLIALCNDSHLGFRAAADRTESPELRALFVRLSRQRIDFSEDLRVAVITLTGDSSAAIHRELNEMKTTFVSDDPQALLIECVRTEQSAAKAFQAVLKNVPLENSCRILVTAQTTSVQASLEQLQALRDHPAYSK